MKHLFNEIDLAFAEYILSVEKSDTQELYLAALCVSFSATRQHSALPLEEINGLPLHEFCGSRNTSEIKIDFTDYKSWPQKYSKKYGFLQILQRFMNRHETFNLALDHANGERVISNIYQLREILHDEEESKGIGLPGLIRFLSEKINSENRDDEEYLQRLETDSDAVQILTIHNFLNTLWKSIQKILGKK